MLLLPCFCAAQTGRRDGKSHRYFSVVENHVAGDRTVQRTVLYLGEINDSQQMAWRKTLEVFDEEQQQTRTWSLFPDDREVPAETLDSLQVNLAGLELRRPRPFGNCWLASELWRQLGLTEFWRERLPAGRADVSWEKVLRLLVVNRLLEQAASSVQRHWFVESAMMSCWPTSRWPAKTGCIGVRSHRRTQAGTIRPPEAEVGRAICRRFRSAALRSDEHVAYKVHGRVRQGQARLQSG